MSKPSAPMGFEPPPYAPPTYSTAVGGVPPQSPYAPIQPQMAPGPATYYPPAGPPPPMGEKMGMPPPQAQYPGQMGPPPGGQYPGAAYPGQGYAGQQVPLVSGQPIALPTAIVTTVVPLGSQSTHMICPHCHAEVDTATKQSPSLAAYLSGLVICLVGCWMGCCLIPCCIQDCMVVEHNCPNCKAFLGKYKRG